MWNNILYYKAHDDQHSDYCKKNTQPYFSQHHTLSNVVIVVVVVDDVVVGSSGSGCGGVVGGVVLALFSHCCAVEILLLSITMEPRLKPSHLHGD